jgi:hypothetical protein
MPEMKRPLQLRCWLPRSSEFFGASSLLAWQVPLLLRSLSSAQMIGVAVLLCRGLSYAADQHHP